MTLWTSCNKDYLKQRLNKFLKFDYKKIITFKENTVESKKLDFFKFNTSFIKIDTEGYEYNVIKGAEKTIKKNNPLIIIEYNDNNYIKIYV